MEVKIEYLDFDSALKQVTEQVSAALSAPPLPMGQLTRYLAQSRGKQLRAKSLLLCAMDEQNQIHPDAVKFAAAIEILHLATLVHDDVMDDADLRRGATTLQKEFGKKTAVICGDYLLCIALSVAASVSHGEEYLSLKFPDYAGRICMGELLEHLNRNNFALTVGEYLKIIDGKTAALFEMSFYAGIIFVTKEQEVVDQYARLGRYVGMIFQLLDDCADYEESVEKEKKPVLSDFEQGVITLPLIRAMQDGSFRKKAARGGLSPREVRDFVRRSGSISYAKGVARQYYDKGCDLLYSLPAAGDEKRRMLQEILNQSYRLE